MKPTVYIHVFKTGGTTATDWLCRHYKESSVPPDPSAFRENPSAYLDTPLLRGHVALSDVIQHVPAGRVLVSMVRDPEAQFMSALWHFISENKGKRQHRPYDASAKLTDQAHEFATQLDAGQVRFLPSEHFHRLGAVGLTERLLDTLRLFAWKLNLPAPRDVPHARKSGAGQAEMPAEVRHILRDRLAEDQKLYAAARLRFDADFATLCDLAGSESGIDDYLDGNATI